MIPAIPTCCSPRYTAQTPVVSMRKPQVVADHLLAHGLVALHEPLVDPVPLLRRLHHPTYVQAVLTGGQGATSAFGVWSEAIRDGVLAMHAGQLHGAALAFAGAPVVGNLAQGFHHARPHVGNGFCTFNGLALIAEAYSERAIGVLDVDEHEGDGTSVFAMGMPNLFNATIFGTRMDGPLHERVRAVDFNGKVPSTKAYLAQVKQACLWLAERRPDLVLYNAGMDCHRDDPLATLKLTTETIRQRDRFAFRFWRERQTPVLFCLAGGYQMPLTTLAALHAVTWEEAGHGVAEL